MHLAKMPEVPGLCLEKNMDRGRKQAKKVQDNEKTIDEKHLRVLFFINKWVTK